MKASGSAFSFQVLPNHGIQLPTIGGPLSFFEVPFTTRLMPIKTAAVAAAGRTHSETDLGRRSDRKIQLIVASIMIERVSSDEMDDNEELTSLHRNPIQLDIHTSTVPDRPWYLPESSLPSYATARRGFNGVLSYEVFLESSGSCCDGFLGCNVRLCPNRSNEW